MTIKAIETVYNSYRFRSRLEARWAVFFDTLGVKYEYEKEGFDLGGDLGYYLPDFWLPALDCWLEVKGDTPTAQEQKRLAKLTENKRCIGIIRHKTPDAIANQGYMYAFGKCIGHQVFVECLACGTIGVMSQLPDEELARLKLPWTASAKSPLFYVLRCSDGCQREIGVTTDSQRIIAAYAAARQARFEHGEKA